MIKNTNNFALGILLLFSSLFLLGSCSTEPGKEELPGSPPVADAGPDVDGKVGEEIVLDASGSSDPDGDPLSFSWAVIEGPEASSATITNGTADVASFIPDVEGQYTFEVTVTDEIHDPVTDQMIATVELSPVEISGNIDENTVLEDIFVNSDNPDYIVTGNISVNAELTVMPGVVIHFQQNRSFTITSGTNAMMVAEGTSDNPIVFTSANVAGEVRWSGIIFESADARNSLSFVNISWAGSEDNFYSGGWRTTSVGVEENGSLKITNSSISHSGDYGLYVDNGGSLNEFLSNTFENNVGIPVAIPASEAHSMDEGSVFSGNSDDVVMIYGSTLNEGSETTWKALNNARYHISGDLSINSFLTINEGAQFQVAEDRVITIGSSGTLIAVGTATDHILFTSANVAGQLYWNGLIVESGDSRNKIDFVDVHWAGNTENFYSSGWRTTAIGITENAHLSIANTTITNGKGNGITLHPNATSAFDNISISEVDNYPMLVTANQAAAIDANTSITGNAQNIVALYSSTFNNTAEGMTNWVNLADGASYLAFGDITVTQPLEILPGATVMFDTEVQMTVEDLGAIIAEGTAENMITFTGRTGVKWDGMAIESNNANNKLIFCKVSEAGNNEILYNSGWRSANVAVNGVLEISNSEITNSAAMGIFVSNTATVNGKTSADADAVTTVESANTFSGNANGNVIFQ